MVLAAAQGSKESFVTINSVRYPVVIGQNGPTPVTTAPQAAFPEPLILGDASRSSDQRMAQVALGDWRPGAGQYRYPAGQGGESFGTFAVSDCDTRFERSLVLRRAQTTLGANVAALNTPGVRMLYVGYAGATVLAHAPGGNLYYWSGAAWTLAATSAGPYIGNITSCGQLCRAGGYTFCVSNGVVCYTSNGTTWTSSASPGAGTPTAIVKHDNKLCVMNVNTNVCTMYYSLNALSAPGAMTWTAFGGNVTIESTNSEFFVQLVVWRNRFGQRCIYGVTNRFLYGYDEDGTTWQLFFDFTARNVGNSASTFAYVWEGDDNLYLTVNTDGIYMLSGTQVDFLNPNANGGIPLGHRAKLLTLAGNSRYLFAWGGAISTDSTSTGGVWCLNKQGGWHRLYRSGTDTVTGGTWANGVLYTCAGGTTRTQIEPDIADIPMNAASSTYTYDAGPVQSHYTAIIDGGMPNVPIRPLYVEARAIKQSDGRSQGLTTNTQAAAYIRTNLNTSWVQLGSTLTSADTFPARLPIASGLGVLVSDIDIRIDLGTTDPTATPIITDVILHYERMAQVRSEYTLQLDLREDNPVFKGDANKLPGTFFGKTAHDLKKLLYDLSGLSATNNYRAQVVPFAYGGGPQGNNTNAISLTAAMVRVASSEDPLAGDGVFRVAVMDLSTPASGT